MKYVLIAGLGILAVFLFFLLQIPLGIEPLTELYFENHTQLPKNIFLNKDYNFSFTLNNLEYKEMNYKYEVNAEYNNKIEKIDDNFILLNNNESKTINEEFKINEHFERAKINIKITKLDEPIKKKFLWEDENYAKEIEIHFWSDEIVPVTIKIIPD